MADKTLEVPADHHDFRARAWNQLAQRGGRRREKSHSDGGDRSLMNNLRLKSPTAVLEPVSLCEMDRRPPTQTYGTVDDSGDRSLRHG